MYHQLHDPAFLAVASGGTPALDLFFSATKALDSRITFSRGSSATFINSSGLVETAGSGVARFTHNPTTLASLGLLIEESRTNLLYNNNFGTGWQVNSMGTRTDNQTDPAGGTTASRFQNPTGFITVTGAASQQPSGVTGTVSVYAKGSGSFDLCVQDASGTFTLRATTSCALTSQYQRFTATAASPSTNSRFTIQNLSAGADITLAFVQHEAGAFATSYIPTTSATATRAADVATMTGTNFSSWYNSSQGTFVATAVCNRTDGSSPRILGASSGGASTPLYLASSGTTFTAGSFDGTSVINTSNSSNVGVQFSAASAYATSQRAVCLNGGAIASTASFAGYPYPGLSLGSEGGNVHFLNGTIARIRYYRRRFPNANLQTLTT